MDMLQVGSGMSFEEDKSHFSMWCLMNSPLLAGNDLRNMSEQTRKILTNKDLIALNQDALLKQAERVKQEGGLDFWIKPLAKNQMALAVLNRTDKVRMFSLDTRKFIDKKHYWLKELWSGTTLRGNKTINLKLPPHGIILFRTFMLQ